MAELYQDIVVEPVTVVRIYPVIQSFCDGPSATR